MNACARAAFVTDFASDQVAPAELRASVVVTNPRGQRIAGRYAYAWGCGDERTSSIRFEDGFTWREGTDAAGDWLLRPIDWVPVTIAWLRSLMDYAHGTIALGRKSYQQVKARSYPVNGLDCFRLSATSRQTEEVCFDRTTGLLRSVDAKGRRYTFDGDVAIGSKRFPRRLRVVENGRGSFEMEFEGLVELPSGEQKASAAPPVCERAPTCRTFAPPRRTYEAEVSYPEANRLRRESGNVHVWVRLDETGAPVAVKVIGPRSPAFDAAVADAVGRSFWAPALCNGRPISNEQTIEVFFILD